MNYMTTELYHLPPQAVDVEESVLASCFFGYTDDICSNLLPDHFYRSAHQKIYSVILGLLNQDIKPELMSVATALRESNRLEEIGGATYLASLIDNAPISVNIPHHIKIIRDKYALRKMIEISNTITRQCFENTGSVENIIDLAQKQINEIQTGAGGTFVSYGDLTEKEVDYYDEISNKPDKITGIKTGFHLIDHITCGLQETDLIIIAARPSMGKTALAVNIAGNVGRRGVPVAIFSLEMSKRQIYARQTASESNVNSQKFRSGKFSQDDWLKMTTAFSKTSTWPVYLDDSAALHYTEIRRRAWEIKKQKGIRMFIIDHLQLIRGDSGSTRDREIGSITAGLKAMAKDLEVPVVLLSQLNRKLDERSDKRPRLSDLRDSGNIEQDADVIAFLYRDEVYDEKTQDKNIAELNFAKQRNGPTGMARLFWNEKTTTFTNLEYNNGK